MNIVAVLLPVAVVLAVIFLIFFLLAARDGQFEDLDDPPRRILQDDD
jgi:cbb3-type cytochrome oxidase maturation protein